MVYVLVGMGTFVALVAEIADNVIEARESRDTADESSSFEGRLADD
ncbi:MAG: hypothetical protein GY708_09535 [Actinomycetia bacterium]|nr:hypothetical protein [Actinomycetes bacterium]MCP4960407.1 hypothetical protein [Actinomycetes bacterium]